MSSAVQTKWSHNRRLWGLQQVLLQGDQPGCFTHIGYVPPDQPRIMNLGADCHRDRAYLHEFGHVFGLYHGHQHPDRRVIILCQGLGVALDQLAFLNLAEEQRHDIEMNYAIPTFAWRTDYDDQSIMHYSSGLDLCVPTHQHPINSAHPRWCDIFETTENKCEVPTASDCLEPPPEVGGDVLSPGDMATLWPCTHLLKRETAGYVIESCTSLF